MTESASSLGRAWLQRIARARAIRESLARDAGRERPALLVERLEDRWQPAALLGVSGDGTDVSGDAGTQDYWLSFRDSGEYGEAQIAYGNSSLANLATEPRWLDYASTFKTGDQGFRDAVGDGYFGEFFLVGDGVIGGTNSAVGSSGGYLDPSDGVPHPDLPDDASTLFDETGPGAYFSEFDRSGGSFAPPITPDARFKGGRDVLPAGSSHMAFGGGYTLSFGEADVGAVVPASPHVEPTEDFRDQLNPGSIADDAPEKAIRPTAPLRAAAGVSQTFELSAAPEELRSVEVAEPEAAPIEAAAIAPQVGEVLHAPAAVAPEGMDEENVVKPQAVEIVLGLASHDSSTADRDAESDTASAADQFWAAIGADEESLAQCGAPGASCFFERNEALIQKTSSAVAAAALAGLLHRGWKLRRRTSSMVS